MKQRPRLTFVGHGMLAVRALERLTRAAPGRFDIRVLGAEPRLADNRILLPCWLAGDCDANELPLYDAQWYDARGIDVHVGTRVVAIDRTHRVVHCADGTRHDYDLLVLATGSRALRPTLPSAANAPAMHTLRTFDDVAALLAAAPRRVVVQGGGVLGLEAAWGLRACGAEVTVVHRHGHVMEKQLDALAGALVRRTMEAHGVAIVCERTVARLDAAAVVLDDGTALPCDALLCAIGATPRIELARACGLPTRRGVVVDAFMRTADPHVFALGECAEQFGRAHGVVAPLVDQLEGWLAGLLGQACTAAPARPVTTTRLKVPVLDVFVAGELDGAHDDVVVLRDPDHGVLRELRLRANRLVGARLIGSTADAARCLELIRTGQPLDVNRVQLALGLHDPRPAAHDDVALQEQAA